jgi:hypothetical protein
MWSISPIIQLADVMLDPAGINGINLLNDPTMYTPAYAGTRRGTPVLVEGGCQIARLNQRLGELELALQTSGANDGHR